MNSDTQEPRPYGFVIGMLTGTVVGAGLAMWLAPRAASELRERVTDSARSLGKLVGQQHQRASTYVAETAEELTRRGQGVRDNIADAVAHRAHEVEAYATASKSGDVRTPPAADRAAAKAHVL
jgi:gas vesicle protein